MHASQNLASAADSIYFWKEMYIFEYTRYLYWAEIFFIIISISHEVRRSSDSPVHAPMTFRSYLRIK